MIKYIKQRLLNMSPLSLMKTLTRNWLHPQTPAEAINCIAVINFIRLIHETIMDPLPKVIILLCFFIVCHKGMNNYACPNPCKGKCIVACRVYLSRFVTPDWVTDHVTGQVTFHRPFQSLFMFVYLCLLMFGHLTFSGNCI